MSEFMNDPEGQEGDFIGTEKMAYSKYYLEYVTRRPTQAPTKTDVWSKMALPNGSVVHTLNGFDTLVAPDEGMPESTLPVIVNEKFPIYLKLHTQLADATSKPFGVMENYIYRPNTMMPMISHFFQKHRRFHRILSDRTLATMQGVLTWVDYSPLNDAKVNGTLGVYRKFDMIFRTILDNVVKIGKTKNHYILLQQGDQVFGRSTLQRAYKDLSTSTLNALLHDPSIFPILHLLAFVYGKTNELSVTPYKTDVKLLGADSPVLEGLRSTSLLERLDPSLFDTINFVIYREDQVIVYNLGDLAKFAEDSGFYTKFYRHMMNIRLTTTSLPAHVNPDSEQFDNLVSNLSGETVVDEVPSSVVTPSSVDSKPVTDLKVIQSVNNESKATLSKITPVTKVEDLRLEKLGDPKSFEEKIRLAAKTVSDTSLDLSPAVITKRDQLIENHLNVSIGGKSLGELIQNIPDQTIAPKKMDFIKSTPEESYKTSSLLAMDRAYHRHAYHHELAKVIGSLGKHGLFATKIDEEKTNTEMDKTTTFKVSLSDINGKAHHVKFTLPDVDDDGLMKLGGVEYRLTRQITNVPICKISPTRVNLSSYYNKVIVERVQSKRNSYEQDISKLVLSLRNAGLLKATAGSAPMPTVSVPYDYTAIGRNFTDISFDGFHLIFSGDGAPVNNLNNDNQDRLDKLTQKYGVYVGDGPELSLLFWDKANQLHQINRQDEIIASWKSFNHLLADRLGNEAIPDKTTSEWTHANLLNQTIPLVFILAYKFGLKTVLDMIRLDYRFYPTGSRAEIGIADISIKFSDGTLVFNRYPLARSLIAGGLSWVNLKDVSFKDLSLPDTYARVFQKKDMSIGVLKGLTGFFDFFVDPITETVLEKMGEPTTFHELLLRANVMLSDYVSEESSSIKLHRFRLYERLNGIVYNEIYRALANHRNNPSSKKAFSINPEAVFQKTVQDATVSPNDSINPVHEVKQLSNFTYTGSGGRTPKSFVPKDLIYPPDALGVISDAVPDSGKVGITAYLSASPNIDNIHGIAKPYEEGDALEPPQILSIGSMVMPGGTTDDGKRNSYLSIQISHYVPNHDDGETLSVRTGYDEVLPHLSSEIFATAAEDNGIVESIDEKQKVVRVRYADSPTATIRSLKLPYLDNALNQFRMTNKSFGYLIPEEEISSYPMGGIFNLNKTTNGKIVDRLRCETLDSIPDKEVARKQNNLIQDFNRGRHKALYYIRFTPLGTTTPGTVKTYSYTDVHSPVSGAYLLQKRIPNVKAGDRFKAGDILIYNPGFFVPDPLSKQVTFKHGVTATIALIEKSSNHEDACEISREFSKRLKMNPCHQRSVITKNDAAILDIVKLGDHVETSDSLCVISDEYLIQSSLSLNIENLDIMEKLNRQTPSADYTGTIRKMRVLYGCDREKLSESLKTLLKVYEKEVRDNFKALNSNPNIKPPERPGWVAPGTKYSSVEFTADTVVIEFMIEETLDVSEGDKICISNAAKSIVSYVNEKQHFTESGIPVDILFSTTSVVNRIINSPYMVGLAERNMEELKVQALDLYFEDKK